MSLNLPTLISIFRVSSVRIITNDLLFSGTNRRKKRKTWIFCLFLSGGMIYSGEVCGEGKKRYLLATNKSQSGQNVRCDTWHMLGRREREREGPDLTSTWREHILCFGMFRVAERAFCARLLNAQCMVPAIDVQTETFQFMCCGRLITFPFIFRIGFEERTVVSSFFHNKFIASFFVDAVDDAPIYEYLVAVMAAMAATSTVVK